MAQREPGKISVRDEAISRVLTWSPWLAFVLLSLPLPVVFLLLFISATATDSAALYLLLSLSSLGLGIVVGLLAVIILFLYKRSWLRRLRNRLAADGITANEVAWFTPELTIAERQALREIRRQNPLLADAYLETLASRLTATRIKSRAGQELVRVERRINRARTLAGVDTAELLGDLQSDRERYVELKREANLRLTEAKARLQTIEAAASRSLNQSESELMLRRLSAAQDQLPLVMEMAKLEQDALRESRKEIEGTKTRPQE
jgi:hypothetical protein